MKMDRLEAIAQECIAKTPPPSARSIIEMKMVPVETVIADERYQRRLSDASRSRIAAMMRDFSWPRFGAIVVAKSDQGLSVVDGQHRLVAARLLGITEVPAVMCNADLLDQARDFVGINTTRTSVASIDKFRARVAAEDPIACKVAETLAALEITTDVPAGAGIGPRETRAVVVLERIAKSANKGLLFNTLELMLDAQPDQPNLLTAFAIEAVAKTLALVGTTEAALERLERVVAETDFDTLRENAAQLVKIQGGKTSQRGHELLLREYNRGLKASRVA